MTQIPIIDAGPVPEKGDGPFTQLVATVHGGIGGMRYGSFAGKAGAPAGNVNLLRGKLHGGLLLGGKL